MSRKLTDDERKAVVTVRTERAFNTLEEAIGIVESGYWHAAANRLYYSCYYIVSALLISKGFDASTHSGVIRLFGLHFVSTGMVSKNQGKFYSKMYELRQSGDYDDWKELSEEDIMPLVEPVKDFIHTINNLIIQ